MLLIPLTTPFFNLHTIVRLQGTTFDCDSVSNSVASVNQPLLKLCTTLTHYSLKVYNILIHTLTIYFLTYLYSLLFLNLLLAMKHTITACIVTAVKNASDPFHQPTCWRFMCLRITTLCSA